MLPSPLKLRDGDSQCFGDDIYKRTIRKLNCIAQDVGMFKYSIIRLIKYILSVGTFLFLVLALYAFKSLLNQFMVIFASIVLFIMFQVLKL